MSQAPTRELSRHVTPDGRNSLRQHLFSKRSGGFPMVAARKELAPLFVAVGGAVVLGTWFGARHLFSSPNVTVNKLQRKSTLLDNEDKARRFVQHRQSMRSLAGYGKNDV
mmetsp:Transcript_14101/g.20853  ORF Transcript_14101/g.20853 Transcript_14101/m.20853 type:complete len:110 (-) Transcript_14101:45-374(-)|eukprot:CAMPEP_0171452546 /NCGR_PEP_ID=MMETSP0945-20130129/609_1 /TAXON_ID=109269 /ORGANISM="Vaucheria litorea, Strain CCMP2940" /LENGTH=109 /DNA_ID=CAMNT_0011977231 /DNA_START=118 /DNA_END=447 /DNA_ORIENTATION=-